MNRFEFGTLVASLRNDMQWTQQELSARSGVDISAISNIERGARSTLLKDNTLVKLADGFQLTSMERTEFMFAASGVTEVEKVRKEESSTKKQFNARSFIKETGKNIASITIPAFVADAFCDIVLANHCVLDFYNIPAEMFQGSKSAIGKYNMMRYIFDPRSNFVDIVDGDRWNKAALINTRYFRKRTLRVRSKPYFSKLLNEFLDPDKYPAFKTCWQKILFEDHDDYLLPILETDPDNAHEFVTVETLLAITPHGDLYLHQLLPLNRKTADRMEKISKRVGEGYEQFSAFPDKRKL
jgi:transcriptional regulator with XRE-family HTH domain